MLSNPFDDILSELKIIDELNMIADDILEDLNKVSSGLDKVDLDTEANNEAERSTFNDILKEMLDLHNRKNADYGGSFDESLDEDGLLVSKIRLGDKYRRFSQLINNDTQVKDESIRDTLIDLANYAVMTILWMDKKGGSNDV